MRLAELTPMILTANCDVNIAACLSDLDFAERIVVIDSGSTDETLAICAANPKVEVIYRKFDHHAAQRSFGLAQIQSGWALCLDSDYRLTPEFLRELTQLPEPNPNSGYFVNFGYCIFGKPLRASLLPGRVLLARANELRVDSDGHAERFSVSGSVGQLRTRILHDDRKPLERWLPRQIFYARMEAKKLAETPDRNLRWQDRIRKKIVLAPILIIPYAVLMKGLWREGWRGYFYLVERVIAELIISLAVLELRYFTDPDQPL